MSALDQMYQQVILDHAKHPHGRGLVDAPAGDRVGESHQVNPTCGDEVTLRVAVAAGDGGQVVDGVSWEGQGCSISQASVSVMTELVTGLTLEEVAEVDAVFHRLMASRGKGLDSAEDEDLLGDATAFTGTSQFPARIKCALLGWAALKDSLARSGALAQ
ncbi:Fe-S cluster assembly sulfur transfer protein SufU [Xylanimonas ulmi]|uniref:Nitrogen fixation NifU-like protein n=1 Tax=Xylanimonas ulmi TaxID=228973 RepID=A0A4Q7M0D8_9MICO|nr:SUF system NifU family Fe-S cluster assembly protein [Xylanibacterium ulmi]RZS61215.1 nitrogen fixation NifU-like protein [Xylanibacterium ulmi]